MMLEKEREQMNQMMADMQSLSRESAAIAQTLQAYYAEKNAVLDALKNTHENRMHEGRRVVVGLERQRSPERVALFANLDKLNREWAPEIARKRRIDGQIRQIRGDILRVGQVIMRAEAKEAQRAAKTIDGRANPEAAGLLPFGESGRDDE